jgi:hypothetical protein
MRPEEFWQNFQLGAEQEIACNFIYDGLRNLHDMETLSAEREIFPVLYNLAIGIERLLKVAVVLLEYEEGTDIGAFEKDLITHNHLELADRIKKRTDFKLGDVHIALLGLLASFYRTHRYDRFTLNSVYELSKEKKAFHEFLQKHLKIDTTESMFGLGNSLQVRRFIGKAVKRIAKQIYKIVQKEAMAKNIYTYEISGSDSKAAKILWGKDEILFEDEEIAMVEIFIFLMKTETSPLMDYLRSIEPLELDPALSSDYLQVLLKKRTSETSSVLDEMEARYEELTGQERKKRIEMITALKSPHIYFDSSDEDE